MGEKIKVKMISVFKVQFESLERLLIKGAKSKTGGFCSLK